MTEGMTMHGFYEGRRVLVTGGAGFIGSHLAHGLASLGAEVRVLDDLSSGRRENLDGIRDRVWFKEASILDAGAVGEAVAGCDLVFHEAALASVPASVENPSAYLDVNITGTMVVLAAAAKAGVRRVVFASSSSVYGEQPVLPKHEEQLPDPVSPYAMTKLAGEHLMRVWSRCYGVSTVSLRYFNIFGPGQRADSAYAAAVAAFATALLSGRRPTIFGDGTASRDFTYIDNVVQANLRAGSASASMSGDVYNVAMGERVTVLELAKVMAEEAGRMLPPVFAAPRAGDVAHSVADILRIRGGLGYQPTVGLREGLKRTLDWYRTQAR